MDTPDNQNYSGDQLAAIAAFRTRAGELADLLETVPQSQHDQGTWAEATYDLNEHPCGTPSCALGWAVHKGIVPGARLAVIINRFGQSSEGLKPLMGPAHDFPKFEITEGSFYGKGARAAPVIGDRWYEWEDIAKTYFGAVMLEKIFYSDRDLDEIIALTRQYAATGQIEVDDVVFYHAADSELSMYAYGGVE